MTDFYSAGRRPTGPPRYAPPADRRPDRRHTGPTRRRWPRRLLVATNVMVAVCIIGAVSAYGYVQWKLDQIHREKIDALTSINGGKPFTMLIVGSDTRSALANNADNQQFGGAAAAAGQRSDTVILARIAPATRQIMMLSLPRDLWVNIPGHGMNRINSAFDSGANLLVQTIQTDLNIEVNHYVEVNFDTFRQVTDAVGGISFYFPTPAKDAYSLLNVTQPGCTLLTGDQALGFVRSRHYEYYLNGSWHFEAESDLARIQRQQAFIRKMVKKAESKFTDITAVNGVINGITKNLTVDSGFSNSLLLNLARDFHGIDPSAIATLTLPNYGFTTSGGAQVLGLQQPQAAQTIAAFNAFGNTPPPSPSSASGSASKTPKTTAPPKVNPPSVTVAPATVSVEAVNGDGVPGQAGKINSFLTAKGYRVVTSTASPGSTFAVTEVHYAPDAHTAAQQIAALIPGGAKLVKDSSLTPTPYNVEVISGASYTSATGGTPVSSSSSSSTTPGATTTTVPGTNKAVYVLPGMPAGQTPPAC